MLYLRRILTGSALLALLLLLTARAPFWHPDVRIVPEAGEANDATLEARGEGEAAEDRAAFYHTLLRDPATGEIPANIRAREVAYAQTLPVNNGLSKAGVPLFNWMEAGPNDVGGRTRALAADVRTPNIALAAGVSGGIWRTTDGGLSWRQVSDPLQALNVVSLAQDVRAGQQNTWYAVTGEAQNNTASDRGFVARYEGKGIYKSTDNGASWTQIVANPGNPTTFDAASNGLDYGLRVAVSPTTGTVFYCSYFFGLYRSTNGGASFAQAFGGLNQHIFCDIAAAPDGSLLLGVSSPPSGGTAQRTPGAYRSTDDGVTWTQVGAGVVTSTLQRVVVAVAPSNPSVGYFFAATGSGSNTPVMYRLDLNAGTAVDRSANLPTNRTTALSLQGGYNMVVGVKPDDPNFVVYGATSLFRTRDGFATAAGTGQNPEYWIGGYAIGTSFAQYPNHHPDQHIVYFEPGNPNRMWSGHDGGLSRTQNVAGLGMINWDDLNRGYNVTQMYTVAQPEEAGDNRITGGTQDNGTPLLNQAGDPTVLDISTGDGSYAAFISDRRVFSSSQQGRVIRLRFDPESDNLIGIAYVAPTGAFSGGNPKAQLFVHPFVVDPVSDVRMIYPEGDTLWRNNNLPAIPDCNACASSTNIGWEKLDAVLPAGYVVSTLELTKQPAGRLYYAGYNGSAVPAPFPRGQRVRAARLDGSEPCHGRRRRRTAPAECAQRRLHPRHRRQRPQRQRGARRDVELQHPGPLLHRRRRGELDDRGGQPRRQQHHAGAVAAFGADPQLQGQEGLSRRHLHGPVCHHHARGRRHRVGAPESGRHRALRGRVRLGAPLRWTRARGHARARRVRRASRPRAARGDVLVGRAAEPRPAGAQPGDGSGGVPLHARRRRARNPARLRRHRAPGGRPRRRRAVRRRAPRALAQHAHARAGPLRLPRARHRRGRTRGEDRAPRGGAVTGRK